MSTKTITKRVALATVVALGAGVLSLVSVTSANAALATGSAYATNSAAGGTNSDNAAGVMNVATQQTLTGSAVLKASSVANYSSGLLAVGDIAGGSTAGTTQTATLLSTGAIVLYTSTANSTANAVANFVVTGGIISATGTGDNAGASVINASSTIATFYGLNGPVEVAVKPNSGATSFTVAEYNGTVATYSSSSATANASPTSGTLVGFITVTVAASSVAGTVSAAKSAIYYEAPGATTQSLSADDQTSGVGSSDWATKQYANIAVADAYGAAIASTTGLLQASATNGALVALTSSGAGTATQATAFLTGATPNNSILTVKAPLSVPVSTVVTITYNGVLLGTKSFTFTGNVAKITLSGAVNGKSSWTTSNTASISFSDSAGNAVYLTGSNTPASGFTADNSGSIISATTLSTAPVSGTPGKISFTCTSTAGTTPLDVKYTNIDGTVVTSNSITVLCSGKATNYTAAYDKTSYQTGDVATLTITFKDSKGNLANDADLPALTTYGTVSTAGTSATISGPSSTNHYSDVLSNGTLVYKYAVGTNAGTFTNPVSFPDVDANAKAAGLSASSVAPSLVVASTGTSLNDVLKGIVSLIASINKQIAALAKLVTKK